MGLIYSSSDSENLISGLRANIGSAKVALEDMVSASQRLTSSIGAGKALDGTAFNAGKDLFSALIIPTIHRASSVFDDTKKHLSQYESANAEVSGEGVLDEDKLNAKKRSIQSIKTETDNTASTLRAMASAAEAASSFSVASSLSEAAQSLENYSESLQQDLNKIEEKLRKLHNFNSAVNGLFNDDLNNFKIVAQSVTVLNKTVVDSKTGSYTLPKGIDESWFNEIHNDKPSEKEIKAISKKTGLSEADVWKLYTAIKKEIKDKTNEGYMPNALNLLKMLTGSLTKEDFLKYRGGGETFNYLMTDWKNVKSFLRGKNPTIAKLIKENPYLNQSFNQFLSNVDRLKKDNRLVKYLGSLKGAKFGKDAYSIYNWITGTGGKLSGLAKKVLPKVAEFAPDVKFLGKLAGKAGWAGVAVSVGYDTFESYNDKTSKGYHNVGKAVVHAGVNHLKSVGPLEGALGGAAIGSAVPIIGTAAGAGIGFVAGCGNTLWGVVSPKSKDAFYNAVEKGGDWVVDKASDASKSIGKAAKGAWNSVTSFFGGGKHAYGY